MSTVSVEEVKVKKKRKIDFRYIRVELEELSFIGILVSLCVWWLAKGSPSRVWNKSLTVAALVNRESMSFKSALSRAKKNSATFGLNRGLGAVIGRFCLGVVTYVFSSMQADYEDTLWVDLLSQNIDNQSALLPLAHTAEGAKVQSVPLVFVPFRIVASLVIMKVTSLLLYDFVLIRILWGYSIRYVLFVFRYLLKKPMFWSKDLTDSCPVNCSCYWAMQQRRPEYTDAQLISEFKWMWLMGFFHVTVVGGEPLNRPSVLPYVCGIMDTWLVTSGTNPLPVGLKNTTIHVSVDGPPDIHAQVRGNKGLYARLLKHIEQYDREERQRVSERHTFLSSKTVPQNSGLGTFRYLWEFLLYWFYTKLPQGLLRKRLENALSLQKGHLCVHTVLNGVSYSYYKQVLDAFISTKWVDGFYVSLLTEIKGVTGAISMSPAVRDEAINMLETLLHDPYYSPWLALTQGMLDHMRPGVSAHFSPVNCGIVRTVVSNRAISGPFVPPKSPCIFDAGADCALCGCTITHLTDILARSPFKWTSEDKKTFQVFLSGNSQKG